jgi:hypothetical protein
MKVKLLKKIRAIGRDQVHVHSVTKNGGWTVGMSLGYSDDIYAGLFDLGDNIEDVLNKACKIYLTNNIESIRHKYRKYSVKNK